MGSSDINKEYGTNLEEDEKELKCIGDCIMCEEMESKIRKRTFIVYKMETKKLLKQQHDIGEFITNFLKGAIKIKGDKSLREKAGEIIKAAYLKPLEMEKPLMSEQVDENGYHTFKT